MKFYVKPEIDLSVLCVEDVLTVSGGGKHDIYTENDNTVVDWND